MMIIVKVDVVVFNYIKVLLVSSLYSIVFINLLGCLKEWIRINWGVMNSVIMMFVIVKLISK